MIARPIILIVLIACFSVNVFAKKDSKSNRPNLVIVFPDQMRGSAMGFLDEEPVLTPQLDKFAEEALVLTNAVSNYPVCSPTRAMLMSGKYPFSNGVVNNCMSRSAPMGVELKESENCWSDVLKENGYSLGYVGKWHLDSPHAPYIDCANNKGENKWNEWCPPARRHGFDYWYAYGTYDYHLKPLYWDNDAGRNDFHYVEQWGPEHEADKAIEYIKNESGKLRHNEEPFALVVAMNPPHTGYSLVPEKYKAIYKDVPMDKLTKRPNIPAKGTKWGDHFRKNIKNYYACITGVDEQFGRIMDCLDTEGLKDNTIVLFISDHGDCIGIHDHVTKNNPYEESMRIPFLLRYPGKIKPRQDDMLMSIPDIYPSLLELMGLKNEIPKSVEGVSYAESLCGNSEQEVDFQTYMFVKNEDWNLGKRGIRTKQYTYVEEIKKEGEAMTYTLFDRLNDPYQQKNIAPENDALCKKFQKFLYKELKRQNDPWGKR
ncbi:DUF229 domain-containing protein [Puteibacter caeruleilacunae]|nr:DUF229 domain-containing protein [Puteibacter caeruleilacunae]